MLGCALDAHVSATESEAGLLAEIMSVAPRLARRVDRARADHARLRSDLQLATAAVDADVDVSDVREQVGALLIDLGRPAARFDLVYDAYNVDIEGSD